MKDRLDSLAEGDRLFCTRAATKTIADAVL